MIVAVEVEEEEGVTIVEDGIHKDVTINQVSRHNVGSSLVGTICN